MDNTSENKLVIASGPDSGRAYPLLQGRTSVGSAPNNDIQLKDQGVSGFHAEIRCETDSFLLVDFNSEKGTLVNGVKLTEEKQLCAGDRIQLGSVHAVFMPHNGIIAKASNPKVNWHTLVKRVGPYYQKWTNKKNRKMLACILPVIVVLMIALAMFGKHNADQKGTAAQHGKPAASKPVASKKVNTRDNRVEKKKTDSAQNTSPTREKEAKGATAISAALASSGAGRNPIGPDLQDRFADIYLDIADRFADYQLWRNALDYYYRVNEKMPDHPELSAHITRMKSEINNQAAYEQGLALIEEAHDEEGITTLKRIPETSFYFSQAAPFIAETEKNLMQAKKSDVEDGQGGESPGSVKSR